MPASSKQNKTQLVRVRLSDDELSKLDSDAKKLGVSRSELVRALISLPVERTLPNGIDGDVGFVLLFRTEEITELDTQLRRWGTHYNQSLKALNIIKQRGLSKKSYDLYTKAVNNLEGIQKACVGLQSLAAAIVIEDGNKTLLVDASDERSI